MTLKIMDGPASPPVVVNPPAIAHLCDVILETLRSFGNAAADFTALRGEVQTLRKFLDLVERIRNANAPRLGFEEEHFSDVQVLLERCRATLSRLCGILAKVKDRFQRAAPQNALQDAIKELGGEETVALRAKIGFFVQSLQMSLQTVKLVYQWKSQLPQDGIYFHHKDLSEAIRTLKETVADRKGMTETSTRHSPIQEQAFLYDVEKCLFSAEVIMNITTSTVYENIQTPSGQLPVELQDSPSEVLTPDSSLGRPSPDLAISSHPQQKNLQPPRHLQIPTRRRIPLPQPGPHIATQQKQTTAPYRSKYPDPSTEAPIIFHLDDINTKHRGSSGSDAKHRGSFGSECESIFDPEPDFEDRFPAAVYSELIASHRLEVERAMQRGDYQKAEDAHRKAMEYMTDRERKLGIPFDDKSDMQEMLAEIYANQNETNKAKLVLSRLLVEEKGETDRKWRLYHSLAKIYQHQDRLPEAEKFAKRAYIGRERSLQKDDDILLGSVNLLINVYEQQNKTDTAQALRRVYQGENIPPQVPPKSKQRETVVQAQPDDVPQSSRSRIRWAPDVWVDSSSINAPTKSGETPLISAISTGDEELVKLMLQRGADVEARCMDQITPLMHAVNHESLPIAETLLDKGAQVDATTAGWPALHRAVEMTNVPLVKLLLLKGADTEARSPKDFSPKKHPLARMGGSDLDDYDEVDAADADIGWTALLRAASTGQETMGRLLVENGASLEARSPSNGTPLICAAEGNHEAVVDFLLSKGANVHFEDDFGWKPLHRVLVNRSGERVAQMLLTHGADVNAKCAYRKTSLHHAVEKGNDPMVCFLLQAGADIEAKDIAERTPLHTAIESRYEVIVRILLDAGADADARDRGGHDALGTANHASRKSPEIIGLLSKHKKAKRGSVGSREASVSASSISRDSSSSSWWSLRNKQKKR